jgi:uncharacterized membrane protein
MFCNKCGTQVNPDLQFCPQCGAPTGATGAAGVPPPPATPYVAAPVWTPRVAAKAETGKWISAGWAMVTADLGNFVLITALFVVVNSFGSVVTQGPLQTGFHLYCAKKLYGRKAEVGDLFKGFDYFLAAFVAALIIGCFVFAGTLLCIVPGLIVAAALKFTYLFILDKKMEFWPAIQASHEAVKNDYFGFTMFLLALACINFLGVLACVVGILVTIPLSIAAITIAYQEVVGFEQSTVDAL